MVSGFLTSPWDQRRMCSAVASPILSWSNMLTSSIMSVSFVWSGTGLRSLTLALAAPLRRLVAGASLVADGCQLSWWCLVVSSGLPCGALAGAALVVFVGAALGARDVDAELLGGAEDLLSLIHISEPTRR